MNKGFVAITTVLILSVVVVAISTTVTLLSIGEAQSSLSLFKGEDNLSFTEGCVEDYLLKIRANPTLPGNITRPEGTCQVSVNNGKSGPVDWDLIISSQTTSYQRKIEVIFTRNTTGISLTSWKEI